MWVKKSELENLIFKLFDIDAGMVLSPYPYLTVTGTINMGMVIEALDVDYLNADIKVHHIRVDAYRKTNLGTPEIS